MEQEKYSQMMSIFEKRSIPQLVEDMVKIKEKIEETKKIASDLQEQFDLIRLKCLPEKMDGEGISTVTVAGVGRASLQADIYFSIPSITKEEAYQWLREHGHGDIIQETVNSSTGKAWAKELLKTGEIPPEDFFKITPFTRAQVTRIK